MKSDVVAWRFLRRAGGVVLLRNADLEVVGLEHVPRRGPVILAARHFHHLYDGCAFLSTIDRPAHIVVGLDWMTNGLARMVMNQLCALARWPIVLRPRHPGKARRPVDADDRRAILRQSARDVTALLREERIVIVFPEGYPNIDPTFTPKQGNDFLPFESGFLRFATIAQRSGIGPIAIVPAGFAYERRDPDRWRIIMRFGEPRILNPGAETGALGVAIESAVIHLSSAAAD